MTDIRKLDDEYIAHTYGRFPVTLVKGKGSLAYDENGKEYIDLGGGIAVNVFGYCDDVWKEAVISQLNTLQHTSNLYYTGPDTELAQKLCQKTGMKKVFFSNSGAEANECAIKAIRKYASETKGKDTYNIITLNHSFHGRTLTTLAATGQDAFHQLFTPLTPGFLYAEPDDLSSVEKLVEENKVAGILMECVQGEGGVNALSAEFVKGVEKICQDNDLVLAIDEVQSGNGRTGALYSYMNYDIHPDVVTTAKGIGGGLPIGVTMLGEKVQDIFHPGDNGSTFGGNPAVCAGACTIIDRLNDDLMDEVKMKSDYIVRKLKDAPGVEKVTGMGLMLGIEPTEKKAIDIANGCLEKGVLVLTAGQNKVRLLPALNIPMDLLTKAVQIIKETFAQ